MVCATWPVDCESGRTDCRQCCAYCRSFQGFGGKTDQQTKSARQVQPPRSAKASRTGASSRSRISGSAHGRRPRRDENGKARREPREEISARIRSDFHHPSRAGSPANSQQTRLYLQRKRRHGNCRRAHLWTDRGTTSSGAPTLGSIVLPGRFEPCTRSYWISHGAQLRRLVQRTVNLVGCL